MFSSRRGRPIGPFFILFLALGPGAGGALLSGAAIAQPLPSSTSTSTSTSRRAAETDGLAKERSRLRLELGRVNGEIDQLKNAERGLRDDYRLRARMADAEAIARRLTELDAQLAAGPAPAARPEPAQRLDVEPGAAPTDGPSELDAKADILADQARRTQAQTLALQLRVDQLRGRQELRRHSGQLEHDPFAPLDGSKRRVLTGTPAGQPILTPTTNQTMGLLPPSSAPTGAVGGDRGITTPGAGNSTSTAPTAAATPRDLLDPGTLAEIRKLEQGGSPSSNVEAMQRAIDALKARAQRLDAQSKALRARAKISR